MIRFPRSVPLRAFDMIDKTVASVAEAVAGIHDGATVMIGGFGAAAA